MISVVQHVDRKRMDIPLSFPDTWEVRTHEMPADKAGELTKEDIRQKIRNPLGHASLYDRALTARQACIVFDDNSRETSVQPVAEVILEELHRAGMKREQIRFICALGTHGMNNRRDFANKLGDEILRDYPVFNHDCFHNLVSVGEDEDGLPVMVNAEFMACDLRIGIGTTVPHASNGFGGGYKLIFPGIVGFDTMLHHHRKGGRTKYRGSMEPVPFRERINHMGEMVDGFFKVDLVINSRLEIVEAFAGDPLRTHEAAMEASAVLNCMGYPDPELKDVIIANANAKKTEAALAISLSEQELREGGTLVLVNFSPAGQTWHYQTGSFGLFGGGPNWKPAPEKARYGELICFTPYPDLAGLYNMRVPKPEKVKFAATWNEVRRLLEKSHRAGTRVSVLPDATISYFRPVENP